MATRTWKHGLWLGLVGFSLAAGCVVKSGDDDDDDDVGEAGDSSGGTSTGGSSTGGRGGSSTGGSATGGTSTGGTATGGSSTGGSSTGGSSTGGSAGMNTDYECDPDADDNTLYPNCTAEADDDCGKCLETNCCEESKVCYGYDPGNVCGWGGIDLDANGTLDGEFNCFVACALDYVEENDVLDEAGKDLCAGECVTAQCGSVIGNATNELIGCAENHCEDDCWPAP